MFKEYLRASFPIYDHANTTSPHSKLDNVSMVGKESQIVNRTIKETMLIRINDPSLNRNIDKYKLPPIWDDVSLNTPDLYLPSQPGPQWKAHNTSLQVAQKAHIMCLQYQPW